MGKRHVLLIVAVILAVLVLVDSYGMSLPFTPVSPTDLDGPTLADSNGKMTAIVDHGSNRMLVLNEQDQVTAIVNCGAYEVPIDVITDVCVSNDRIYAAGIIYKPDSSTIDKERVICFDKRGEAIGTTLEVVGNESDRRSILSLDDAPKGITASIWQQPHLFDTARGSKASTPALDFILVEGDAQTTLEHTSSIDVDLFDASYYPDDDSCVLLDSFGVLSFPHQELIDIADRTFTSVDVAAGDVVYACESESNSLCKITPDGTVETIASDSGFVSVHVNDGFLSLCNSRTNTVTIRDLDGHVLREIPRSMTPSPGLAARVSLVWVCSLFLATLVLVLAIRTVRNRLAQGRTDGFGPLLAAIASTLIVGIAIVSLSYASNQNARLTRESEIGLCSDDLYMCANELSPYMERLNYRSLVRQSMESEAEESPQALDDFITVIQPAMRLNAASLSNNVGTYCDIYGKDDKGIYYLYSSTSEHIWGSSRLSQAASDPIEKAFESDGRYDDTCYEGRTLRDDTIFRLVPILSQDGTRVVGVIEFGSRMRSFEAYVVSNQARQILSLLALMLVVYLLYRELRACGRCLFTSTQIREHSERDAIAILTRPLTLLVTMMSSADTVMTVLIAREILEAMGKGDSKGLLAIPAIMVGVGLMVGQSAYGLLGTKVGLRRIIVRGALATALCAATAAVAVRLGLFWVYCASKLCLAIPLGMLYTLGYSLPRMAESSKVQVLASGGVKRTDTSAAALGAVLGGYAAQGLSNAWLYVMVAFACVPLVLLAISFISQQVGPPERKRSKHDRESVVAFVHGRSALLLALLIVFPSTIAAGYTSFLFPIFSADLGLQKIQINSVYVLGQLIVFLYIGLLDKLEGHWGKWRVSTSAILLLGIVFLLFSLNTTLAWSVVVIALVGMLCKSSDGWKAMWLAAAKREHVQAGEATGIMFAARSLTLVIQPFALSALLGATDSVAVIVIGVFCVLCATLFYACTRQTSIADT